MADLVKQFEEARQDFLETLKKFPKDRVEEKLFGEWNLKDVIAHFSGWDNYFTDSLKLLKEGKAVPKWGTIDKFNKRSVDSCKKFSWEKIYSEFVKSGENFIKEYSNISKELADKLFWVGKKYTPLKFLKINIDHYENAQLTGIKNCLKSGRSN